MSLFSSGRFDEQLSLITKYSFHFTKLNTGGLNEVLNLLNST